MDVVIRSGVRKTASDSEIQLFEDIGGDETESQDGHLLRDLNLSAARPRLPFHG